MNKARRLLRQRVANSDMVIEVLDARLPRASQNPMLAQICRGVPRLVVLTKPDLADPLVTRQWMERMTKSKVSVLELVATDPASSKRLVAACRKLVPGRGRPGFPVRVMIAGIPNVGKSTLFNLLVGKRKAEVRNQPAVTRSEQRIDVPGGLSLVDTPGVLWPKLDDTRGAYCLAASGAIRDSVVDALDVARFVVSWLHECYPDALTTRYGLASTPEDPDESLREIARRRGCLTRGVGPDLDKAAELLLHELRAGRLGRISLEVPSPSQAPEVEPPEDSADS
jgi:ribosome biogenesis GTPase A